MPAPESPVTDTAAPDLASAQVHCHLTWEMSDCTPYGDGSDPGDDFIGTDDYAAVLNSWDATYLAELGEAVPELAMLSLVLLGSSTLAFKACVRTIAYRPDQ